MTNSSSRIYRKRLTGLVVGRFFLASICCCLLSPAAHPNTERTQQYLCLSLYPEQAELARYLLDENSPEFKLSYLHSVALSLVEDQYEIVDNEIVQTSETVADHGAGLPSMDNEPDMIKWSNEGGRFKLELNRAIDKLIVRVNPEYQNRLYVNGTENDIAAWGRAAIEIGLCGRRLN